MRLRALAMMVPFAAALGACSSAESATPDLGPVGDPTIAVLVPAASGSGPVCVAVGSDADARVPLVIGTTELVLRPPGGCGYYVQCGHLDLYVDGVLNNESAVPAIDLLLRKLADRFHDAAPNLATGEPDVLHVRVAVAGDTDAVLADHDGGLLETELELATAESCP
jgi:hypothetical protein